MNAIDRAIEEIAARDAPFAACIAGADMTQISALEALAGDTLPAEYRDFLVRLGRSADWLRIEAADFTIDTMLACYAEGLGRPAPDHWLIGKGVTDPYMDVYLAAQADGATRVVSFPSPPRGNFAAFAAVHRRPVAGSLPQLLALEAFHTLRIGRLPQRVVRRDRIGGGALAELDAVFASVRLSPLWFSNDWVRVYDGADAAVVAYGFPDCAWFATLHASDAAVLRALDQRAAAALRAG